MEEEDGGGRRRRNRRMRRRPSHIAAPRVGRCACLRLGRHPLQSSALGACRSGRRAGCLGWLTVSLEASPWSLPSSGRLPATAGAMLP